MSLNEVDLSAIVEIGMLKNYVTDNISKCPGGMIPICVVALKVNNRMTI